jgi:hypothetical protein
VHQAGAGVGDDAGGRGLARGLVGGTAVHVGAIGFDRGELHGVGAFGHHHVCRDAAFAGGQGQRRAVVAGGMRDDAAGGGIGVERLHGIAGAAELEGADALQVFALEMQLRAGQRVERARAQHGGVVGMRGDARGGGQHVVEGG